MSTICVGGSFLIIHGKQENNDCLLMVLKIPLRGNHTTPFKFTLNYYFSVFIKKSRILSQVRLNNI